MNTPTDPRDAALLAIKTIAFTADNDPRWTLTKTVTEIKDVFRKLDESTKKSTAKAPIEATVVTPQDETIPFSIEKWKEGYEACTSKGERLFIHHVTRNGTVMGHVEEGSNDIPLIYTAINHDRIRLKHKTETLYIGVRNTQGWYAETSQAVTDEKLVRDYGTTIIKFTRVKR